MTRIIERACGCGYGSGVGEMDRCAITSLLDSQRQLEARLQSSVSPAEALAIGRLVLDFAAREEDAFASISDFLDPSVSIELTADHRQIAEDLELLAWLLEAMPESPDIHELSDSLARRMAQHIRRDGRLLRRATERPPSEAAK